MTPRTLIILCTLLTCCENRNSNLQKSQQKIIALPDTTNNWHAKLFERPYYLRKNEVCRLLGLPLLENDTNEFVVRVWTFASFYNPQEIYLINRVAGKWMLSNVSYYQNPTDWDIVKIDSISLQKNEPTVLTAKDIEGLNLKKLWNISTQSEMKNGGRYGCQDGYKLLIELSSKSKYQYTFHICPSFHASKDSTFKIVDQFDKKVRELANR